MADEKLVQSLKDLQTAAQLAAQQGMCKIRLISGETFALYPVDPNEEVHVVTDSEEEKVVLSCLTPGGKTFTGEQLKAEVQKRLRARGM
ncbi:MAG: hypothetical protein ACM3XM_13725 [Mycobacterium leprae]